MARRFGIVRGGRRRGSTAGLLALPFVAILGLFGMLMMGMVGGAGAPANQYADEQEKTAHAAQVAQDCATQPAGAGQPSLSGAPSSAPASTAAAPGTTSGPAATPPPSGTSVAPSSSSPAPPAGPVDPAIIAAQGVELNAEQIQTAQTIVDAARSVNASDRAIASALLAGYSVGNLNGAGELFGGRAASLKTATIDYVAAFRRLDGDSSGVALGDITSKVLAGKASAQTLRPLATWATNLAGYLVTGRSSVVIVGGAVQCASAGGGVPGGPTAGWDAGNIASDAVFYNGSAMTEAEIRSWISAKGAACIGDCLATLRRDLPSQPADAYCKAISGGKGLDAAAIIYRVSVACGVNPQVMLVTLEKESSGVTASTRVESSWAAAWGWHCPDTGPGGTANCDPAYGGFVNQAYGMAKQWRRYVVDAGKYNYRKGQTAEILWNVAESGCGGAPVTIKTDATAALYNYTPYQPNAASLAAYPGEGDACSAYGNRNFFRMFQKWFGSTGGGIAVGGVQVGGKGLQIQLPAGSPVQGVVQAPTANSAAVIRAALSQLGMPYVWAGGDASGPTIGDNETGEIGYDCSGLMIYAYAQIGVQLTHYSGAQAQSGTQRPFATAQPGDLLFWGQSRIHHVAMYLGVFDGVPYMVEAPQRGTPVRVSPVRVAKSDWNGVAVTPGDGAGTAPAAEGVAG